MTTPHRQRPTSSWRLALVALAAMGVACSDATPATAPTTTAPTTTAPTTTTAQAITAESASAAVVAFYKAWGAAGLRPESEALLTTQAAAVERAQAQACREAMERDEEPKAVCDADRFLCAQDTYEMKPPRFTGPDVVVVEATQAPGPAVELKVALEGGVVKIASARCLR
jgi:hypothetical protein